MMSHQAREKENQLSFDIRRSILLSSYIKYWGQPSNRIISLKENSSFGVEIYEFPPNKDSIFRFSTIGLSAQKVNNKDFSNWEFLFCLPEDIGRNDNSVTKNYLLDIMAYSLRSDVKIQIGTTIPESNLAPKPWKTKAILIDEARGEPEEMSCFKIGHQEVNLFWLIPITEAERQYIKKYGVTMFDHLESKSKFSLLDVNRQSMVN